MQSECKMKGFIDTYTGVQKRIYLLNVPNSNRTVLKSVISCLEFYGRQQGIVFRGHRHDATFATEDSNQGNYRVLESPHAQNEPHAYIHVYNITK